MNYIAGSLVAVILFACLYIDKKMKPRKEIDLVERHTPIPEKPRLKKGHTEPRVVCRNPTDDDRKLILRLFN